jgi:hypothetical protein
VLTVILVVVAPVLQFNVPLQPLAVKVELSPTHNIPLLDTMLGVVGLTPVRMIIEFDEMLVPQLFVQLAV